MAAVEDRVLEEVEQEFERELEEYITEYRALIMKHIEEYEAANV